MQYVNHESNIKKKVEYYFMSPWLVTCQKHRSIKPKKKSFSD